MGKTTRYTQYVSRLRGGTYNGTIQLNKMAGYYPSVTTNDQSYVVKLGLQLVRGSSVPLVARRTPSHVNKFHAGFFTLYWHTVTRWTVTKRDNFWDNMSHFGGGLMLASTFKIYEKYYKRWLVEQIPDIYMHTEEYPSGIFRDAFGDAPDVILFINGLESNDNVIGCAKLHRAIKGKHPLSYINATWEIINPKWMHVHTYEAKKMKFEVLDIGKAIEERKNLIRRKINHDNAKWIFVAAAL